MKINGEIILWFSKNEACIFLLVDGKIYWYHIILRGIKCYAKRTKVKRLGVDDKQHKNELIMAFFIPKVTRAYVYKSTITPSDWPIVQISVLPIADFLFITCTQYRFLMTS